jgi:hypothetical protein
MKTRALAIAALAGSLLLPGIASAFSLDGGLGTLTSNGHTYNATGAEAVTLTDTDGVSDDATAFLFLEIAGFADQNTLGIYSFTTDGLGNVSVGDTLEVFAGGDSPITSTTLAFDLAGGTVTNQATAVTANIGSTFGFYLATPESGQLCSPNCTYYSHTSLNDDGFDHFLIFDTSDHLSGELLGSDVVLAIEDLYGGGDGDYNDMVAGVNDVAPVPEPGTLMLLGSGLFGLGAWRRRKGARGRA